MVNRLQLKNQLQLTARDCLQGCVRKGSEVRSGPTGKKCGD